MFVVRDVTIEAGVRTLVRDARFTVQAGDKVGLVGRNGAGKTTLVRACFPARPYVSLEAPDEQDDPTPICRTMV